MGYADRADKRGFDEARKGDDLFADMVFALSAPVREFCKRSAGKIKNVEYVFVHHTNGLYASAADEADKLLGTKRSSLKSFVCRKGDYIKELTEENNA